MDARGGSVFRGVRRQIVLSTAGLTIGVVAAACGLAPPQGSASDNQTVTKPPAMAAPPSTGAKLSPGMTLAPVPTAPPAPATQGADECLEQSPEEALANGVLHCQYFTSGSLMPDSVPSGPGLSSGDYAVRFSNVGGSTLMTVRIPCASYALRVSIVGQTITPEPGSMESSIGTCNFPWDEEQKRMARYLQGPLQFAPKEAGIVLHNPEWGVSLFRTPYA